MAGFNPYTAKGVPTPKADLGRPFGQFLNALLSGRSAAAEQQGPSTTLLIQGDPTGRYIPGSMQTSFAGSGAPSAPALPPPVTSPNTTFQHADDEYNRLKSQFGGTTGVSQLAGMTSLPTGFTPTGGKQAAGLKDYYAAQQEVGERNIGSIVSEMGYKGDMAKWAQANPMLAQREYDKRFGGATLASAVHPDGSVRGMPQAIPGLDTSKMMPTAAMQGTAFPGQGQGPTFNPATFTDKSDFGTIANGVAAHPIDQGRAVSAPYDQAQAQAAEKTAGATGMPNLQTTESPGQAFLKSKLGQALQTNAIGTFINATQGFLPNWGN